MNKPTRLVDDSAAADRFRGPGLWAWLLMLGPGIMVMLADTDVGSIVTAAQSGVAWGYALILPQIVLIPILYLVQEVTVRLGLFTGRGHGTLIREHFGLGWAFVSVSTLFLSSVGALITEFSGIAGVGQLFGVPPIWSVGLVTVALVLLGLSGRYQRVEWVGIALGSLELLFVVAVFAAHPAWPAVAAGLTHLPVTNPRYLWLLAANVGAVIMPWMIFYQQGAVLDKGWQPGDLKAARIDTAVGAVVTQVIMIAIVLVTAATLAHGRVGAASLNTIPQIANALTPALGPAVGHLVFGGAVLGAGFVAALVVSLAGAWGIGEAFGFNHSLNQPFREAPAFYLIYAGAHIAGAVLVLLSANLVTLTVDVEVMNAMLLPIVLGFLLALERRALPPGVRMQGAYRSLVWVLSGLVMAFGLYMITTVL